MESRAERGAARAATSADADADSDSDTHADTDADTGACTSVDQRRHVLVAQSVLNSGDARRMSRRRMDSRA
jgi:hypothetical protein